MRIHIGDIEQAVSVFYGVSVADLRGRSRVRSVAQPRQVIMYLARELTGKSYPQIGRWYNRDHTTILHGFRQVEAKLWVSRRFEKDIASLKDALEVIADARRTETAEQVRRLHAGEISWYATEAA